MPSPFSLVHAQKFILVIPSWYLSIWFITPVIMTPDSYIRHHVLAITIPILASLFFFILGAATFYYIKKAVNEDVVLGRIN